MGLNTTVYTGWIVRAKMSKITKYRTFHGCTKAHKHPVGWNDKFCTKCGSPVKAITVDEEDYNALDRIQHDEDQQTVEQQTVLEKFTPVNSSWVGNQDDEYELLIPNDKDAPDWIEADYEGVHFFDGLPKAVEPSREWLDLLQKAMNYETVEVKFGTLVSRA